MRPRLEALIALLLMLTVEGRGAAVGAGEPEALVAAYLRARDGGALGEVAGRAYEEARRPTGPNIPYQSVPVLLLPYSAELEAALDAIKAGHRDSLRSYTQAARRVTAAREAYERTLLAAGGGELVRGELSDAEGRFTFTGVPAGRWLLLAWREVPHSVSTRRIPKREARQFLDNPEWTGYAALTYWRMRVEVRAGEATAVALHDRNGWLTGVREEQRTPAGAREDGAR